MTPDDFRKLALRLPEVVEQQHQGHPDFRIHGKVFATLGWPDSAWGMIKLPIQEQEKYAAAQPSADWYVNGEKNPLLSDTSQFNP
jgi:hypothetical protein